VRYTVGAISRCDSTEGVPVADDRPRPWGEFELAVDDCRHWRIGPLGFWLRRKSREWQLAQEDGDVAETVAASAEHPPPDDATWTRWATDELVPPVRICPVTPDRAVVVRPADPFRILPHGSARIFVSLPVWVRIELMRPDGPQVLIDLPTVRLSNTWFGTLFEGQLCYWLSTTARRDNYGQDFPAHIANAPMAFSNSTGIELPLEKVALQTANLAIYQTPKMLWTSEVRVTSADPAEPQRIDVSTGPPTEAMGAKRLSEPREKRRESLFTRTFGWFRSQQEEKEAAAEPAG
jgi:hypothetical protein